MHEMLEHDASAIKVVARLQACFENQHGCSALGKSDPIEGSPDVPMRAQRVDADVGIPGMDENLFVLLIPGIERAPAETSRGRPLGAGYYSAQNPRRQTRSRIREIQRLNPGMTVTLTPIDQAATAA